MWGRLNINSGSSGPGRNYSMTSNQTRHEEGSTLIEIIIATVVFIVVLGLSLAIAASFSKFGGEADADSAAQLDTHRTFARIESVLRQGWTPPVISADGESLQLDVLGYSWNATSQGWDRVDPATWRREYDLSQGTYYFVDGSGFALPVATCTLAWERISTDPGSEDYHFGEITSTLSDTSGNSTTWTMASRIGTFELNEAGTSRLPGLSFTSHGQSVLVEMHLQRDSDAVPYSIRSSVKRRNYLEDAQ